MFISLDSKLCKQVNDNKEENNDGLVFFILMKISQLPFSALQKRFHRTFPNKFFTISLFTVNE